MIIGPYKIPDHDWTTETPSGIYGVIGEGDVTWVYWGEYLGEIPLHVYLVVSATLVGLMILASLTLFAARALLNRRERA